eukprot:2051255-Amphidinium_carterae.1
MGAFADCVWCDANPLARPPTLPYSGKLRTTTRKQHRQRNQKNAGSTKHGVVAQHVIFCLLFESRALQASSAAKKGSNDSGKRQRTTLFAPEHHSL